MQEVFAQEKAMREKYFFRLKSMIVHGSFLYSLFFVTSLLSPRHIRWSLFFCNVVMLWFICAVFYNNTKNPLAVPDFVSVLILTLSEHEGLVAGAERDLDFVRRALRKLHPHVRGRCLPQDAQQPDHERGHAPSAGGRNVSTRIHVLASSTRRSRVCASSWATSWSSSSWAQSSGT